MRLNDQSVSQIIFYPRGEPFGDKSVGIPTSTQCNDAQVSGYLHLAQASEALMLFFHGNGEIAADYDSLAPLYTGCGVSFWILDYRGYGRSTDSPSFMRMFSDAEAILADLPRIAAQVGREFQRIILMGRSLGSASAIHLAANHSSRLAGLVLDSPYANGLALIQRLGGPPVNRADIPGFVDNIDNISDCRLPTLIIHGANDQIIPFNDAQALYDFSPAEMKRLVRIENAGHNDLLWVGLDRYAGELQDFIHQINPTPG